MSRLITADASKVSGADFIRTVRGPSLDDLVAALSDEQLAQQYALAFGGGKAAFPMAYLLGEMMKESRKQALEMWKLTKQVEREVRWTLELQRKDAA